MPNHLDQILVLDFQFTCWPEGKTPRGQISEVIDIGICRLDIKKGRRTTQHRLIVQPTRSSISAFCEEQTGLSKAEIKAGMTFSQACEVLKNEFQSRERPWATWGSHERQRFRRQLSENRMHMPMGSSHISIKTLMALMQQLPHELALEDAMSLLQIEQGETPFATQTNAWNAAGVLNQLLSARRSASLPTDISSAPSPQPVMDLT